MHRIRKYHRYSCDIWHKVNKKTFEKQLCYGKKLLLLWIPGLFQLLYKFAR